MSAAAPADAGATDEEIWHGDTASLVRGRIQGHVNGIAASTGAAILAAANAPDRTEKDVTYFGMRLSVSGANDKLLKFLGELENSLRQQAFFVAGIMAYCRCYASSGSGIPMLDAKKVYEGSDDGKQVHDRLIGLRNSIAAHTDASDIVRLTLAVKDEPERLVIRHLWTMAVPVNEIANFLEAVAHTEHFVTISLNKYLNRLEKDSGKTIELD